MSKVRIAEGQTTRPSRAEAEDAVKTLIAYAGDDPNRPGVLETPARVVKAFEEFYDGYGLDAADDLQKTFDEIEGYDDLVLLKSIRFESHCEHHMMPFIGVAHVAYLPNQKVVGISKLARVVDIFAHRLQSQESMTIAIAEAIEKALKPLGVAVILEAEHFCMTMRGVTKPGVLTRTNHFIGAFREDATKRRDLLALIG